MLLIHITIKVTINTKYYYREMGVALSLEHQKERSIPIHMGFTVLGVKIVSNVA